MNGNRRRSPRTGRMAVGGLARPDRGAARVFAFLLITFLLTSPFAALSVFPGPKPASAAPNPDPGSASESTDPLLLPAAAASKIKLPFPSGQVWTVGQGYNTSPTQGGSHWNCDPVTLKDQPTQTRGCRAPYQYRFSFDLYLADGSTANRPLLSPVNGVIRWIDESTGGMSIDLGDGYAVAFFHADLFGGLAAGQTVRQGQQLAVVSPPGGGANGGWPHIHLTVWQTTDGGNWSRNAIPFTGGNALEGIDFADLGATNRNQHNGRVITSTNAAVSAAPDPLPAAPSLKGPASGTTYQTTNPTPALSWNVVSGASDYQVTVNDGAIISPWVSGTTWTMPALAPSEYRWQVKARNANGVGAASAAWTLSVTAPAASPPPPSGSASVDLTPASGSVASTLAVSGSGYRAGEDVRIFWNSTSTTALATAKATSSGNFSANVTVPDAVRGNHTVIARGVTSGRSAQRSYGVGSSLARTPVEGVPGTRIAVTVRGFGASEQVRLTWDGASGATLGTATTNTAGTGSVSITIPEGKSGWHDYTGLGLKTNYRAWGAINVLANFTTNPASGSPGANVQARVQGFPASRSVTIAWNKTATSGGQAVCSGTLNSQGSYGCSFTIPQGASGSVPVVATASDGTTRAATLSITGSSGPVQGGAILGPGTYRVTGTREGLVGGTTSSGHKIVPDDHFVSLPACTSSSCPWLAAGVDHATWGRRTECGQFCYVRVTNPSTNACSVAPVLDVGPWFRVDDWWNPTDSRNLNRRAANPNDLAQGYTGVDAARNGLDVGYGRSANGIGISDKGYEVGNRSAIDIGDGVWADLGFAYNDLMRPDGIVVTLLWQTGASASAAAQACGHTLPTTLPNASPTATRTPTPSPSASPRPSVWLGVAPVAGRVGGRITVTGSGFRVGETVNVHWDTTGKAPRASVTADSRGDISASFSVYSAPIGPHTLIAHGMASGRRAQTVFSVTPTITSSPTETLPGGTVNLNLRGFGAGESVSLIWDGPTGASLGEVNTDSKGNANLDVTLPRAAGGGHIVVATGASSGGRASTQVTFTATFGLAPTQAPVGASVEATLRGYPASAPVQVYWNRTGSAGMGSVVCGGNTTSVGTYSCTFPVPASATNGATYPVVAVSTDTSRQVIFVVAGEGVQTASATASPAEGQSGTRINVVVAGFQPGESVSVYWDDRTSAGGTRTADANGGATIGSTVLTGAYGTHRITVKGKTSGRIARTFFTIVPAVFVSPETGSSGTTITLTGKGFDPGATVSFYWNRTGGSGGTLVCSSQASSSSGTATCTGKVPSRMANGAYPIVAVSGGKTATAPFTVGTSFTAQSDAASPTATSTATSEPTPTGTPAFDVSRTPDASPTATAEPTIDASPVASPEEPTTTPTETPRATPTPEPTAAPTETPTETPTEEPTEVATETPTAIPTAAPTEVPTAVPTVAPAPEPVQRQMVLYPIADTSVGPLAPDIPQDPALSTSLTAGGPDAPITYITFLVTGVAPGTVIDARLALTAAGESGAPGGTLGVLPGVAVDEWSLTYNTVPAYEAPPALMVDGSPVYLTWLDPGVEVWVDVSGSVAADGAVTFVLTGTPGAALTLASRETGASPRLILTVLDSAPVAVESEGDLAKTETTG